MSKIAETKRSAFQYLQLIYFIISLFTIVFLITDPSFFATLGTWSLIPLGLFLIYVGMQIYAMKKMGFWKSFAFLKLLGKGKANRK